MRFGKNSWLGCDFRLEILLLGLLVFVVRGLVLGFHLESPAILVAVGVSF